MNRAQLLRWSLLGSLGVIPAACSSSATDEPAETAEPPSCTAPELDQVSGVTTCAEGYRYRGTVVSCSARGGEPTDPQGGAGGAASSTGGAGSDPTPPMPDFQCTPACEGEHVFCDSIAATPATYACERGCLTDDECADDELCLCGPRGGVCMAADCRSDDDCDADYHCAQQNDICFDHRGRFTCQRPDDECLTRADCEGSPCMLNGLDHRTCVTGVACGRPFLVAAQPRVAPVVFSSDWLVTPPVT